jgi:glutamate-ammonia-ligase adenylyltransferase
MVWQMPPRLSEDFIESLPSPDAARTFMERLFAEHPGVVARCRQDPALLANLLVLATHSPFLGEAVIRRPEYIEWLAREKDIERIKPREELFESLARFAAVQSSLDEQGVLYDFKRRELLRIYLRDCLHLATLIETTLELSNLADVILQRALWQCWESLVSRYGRPQVKDTRGRITEAEFAIVALGKLGSQELNYASDIDLLYLYSDDGMTSGGELMNKEFFIKLSERITRIVGGVSGEGAVYRTDLRLRPRGRDGDIAISLDQAVDYYRTTAQNWERQMLIRARASAGSRQLVAQFLGLIEDAIYRPEPLVGILDDIRSSKERIDQEKAGQSKGIDVKLGRGGIREIEFISQALQLFYGGREPWLRQAQTLISLQRLAEKGVVSDGDRTRLAEAYTFLRTVEHRLQMEHGVRTHTVPLEEEKLRLLARRMGHSGSGDLGAAFFSDLQAHLENVASVFESVFREKAIPEKAKASSARSASPEQLQIETMIESVVVTLGAVFAKKKKERRAEIKKQIAAGLELTLNPLRAVKNLSAFAASFAAAVRDRSTTAAAALTWARALPAALPRLVEFFGVSQFFSQILITNPDLVRRLLASSDADSPAGREGYAQLLRSDMAESGADLPARMSALRRRFYQEILTIGYLDITGKATLRQINRLQAALASASLEVAFEIAVEEIRRKYGCGECVPIFTVLGLGRLGHNGVDYGSDLDVIVVYDDGGPSPVVELQAQEAYIRMTETVIHVLSAITREGYLYRVDLRLRPGGSSRPLAVSWWEFREYLETEAATWERLAYLKAYPVVGDADFGQVVHSRMQELILRRRETDDAALVHDVREMRDRLEREKAGQTPTLNFKFGAGGMMDVYFATRFLQLKHQIAEPQERGTLQLVDHLTACGALTEAQHQVLYDGYSFLRRLDHALRLLFDRPTETFPVNRSALADLAEFLKSSTEELESEHRTHREKIRSVYDELVR